MCIKNDNILFSGFINSELHKTFAAFEGFVGKHYYSLQQNLDWYDKKVSKAMATL